MRNLNDHSTETTTPTTARTAVKPTLTEVGIAPLELVLVLLEAAVALLVALLVELLDIELDGVVDELELAIALARKAEKLSPVWGVFIPRTIPRRQWLSGLSCLQNAQTGSVYTSS